MTFQTDVAAEAARMASMIHPDATRTATDLCMMAIALADARRRLADNPESVRDAAIVLYYAQLDLTAEQRAIVDPSPYQRAFPDYDPSTLPSIPAGWVDRSWRNETSPSFQIGEAHGLIVFTDYARPEDREYPELKRFTVHGLDQFGQLGAPDTMLLETDDWAEVLAYVERHQRLERLTNGQMNREDAEIFLREEEAAERPCPDMLAMLRHALED